jgi:hypothetical protein
MLRIGISTKNAIIAEAKELGIEIKVDSLGNDWTDSYAYIVFKTEEDQNLFRLASKMLNVKPVKKTAQDVLQNLMDRKKRFLEAQTKDTHL